MGADIFFHVEKRPVFAPQVKKTLEPWFRFYKKGNDPMAPDLGYYYRDNYNPYSLARLADWAGKAPFGRGEYYGMGGFDDDPKALAVFFGELASVTNKDIDAYVGTVLNRVNIEDTKKPFSEAEKKKEVAWIRAKRDFLKAILKAKILRVTADI